jgi:hypothetical protein
MYIPLVSNSINILFMIYAAYKKKFIYAFL